MPHEGTGWQESSRCRLFQRIAGRAWDEAVQALAWALNNGPSERAMPYVAKNNPYRIPSTSEGEGA